MSTSTIEALAHRVAQAVDAQALEQRLRGLARFGALDGGGVNRPALGPDELQARAWLVHPYATRPGYEIGVDAAANLFIRREGLMPGAPVVLSGSHLDTQPTGGWLDGAFGVVAALAVLDALEAADVLTERSVEVVAWTNEEGVRYAPGSMGSAAFVCPDRLEQFTAATDCAGTRFADACEHAIQSLHAQAVAQGWTLQRLLLGRAMSTYVEAHIEQGPVLEASGHQVGCVQGIQGVRWLAVEVGGRSAHAGTTPMERRDDAMVKAVAMAGRVLGLPQQLGDERLRLTIGQWQVEPGAINTIANKVRFTIDVRHPEQRVIDAVCRTLREQLGHAGAVSVLFDNPPVQFDSTLVSLVEHSAQALGLRAAPILSGAFHDAMHLARHVPTAMVFAPSRDGVSHHPDEDTPIADLVACTRVLAACLTTLAGPFTGPLPLQP